MMYAGDAGYLSSLVVGTAIGAVCLIAAGLGVNLAIQLVVARLLQLDSDFSKIAVLVNYMTNPVFNLFAVLIVVLQFGRYWLLGLGAAVALQLLVVILQWRLSMWALGGTSSGSPRLQLVQWMLMNLASVVPGCVFLSWLVWYNQFSG